MHLCTRTGKMSQEPLYLEGHPKRIEQDSQRNNIDAPSPSKRKKKKNDRTLHASSEPVIDTPENPNDISISMSKHNLVMNMNLVIMLMTMFMLMLNLVILITHNQRTNVMIRETLLLGSTARKENHGFRNLCLFLLNHPRRRIMRILSVLLK